MKSINRILGITALSVLIGVGTSKASVQASFHLPVTTHWGRAVLAPGDYKLFVKDGAANSRNLMIQGEGRTVYAMPLVADSTIGERHSYLQLVERDGSYFIKEFCSRMEGKSYTFSVPKKLHSEKSITVEIKN